MNNYLIKSAHILFPGSPFHDQVADVWVKGGVIHHIAKQLSTPKANADADQVHVIEGKGRFLMPGFLDLNANFGEPGYETKEDMETGSRAALAGGFTAVAVQPNTDPPLHRHAEIALVNKRAEGVPVAIYPIGTVSKRREGTELAEMYDMQRAGAVAFSDGDRSIQDAGLMSRALLYAKGIEGLVISFADDRNVSEGGAMNEGDVSTYLGMKGNPNLAEALMVARDLYLAEYHQARIHFTTISTAESVELIKKARARGVAVSCDVAAHHLVWTDESVKGFDSAYKVHPPLRTKKDVKALIKGLKDGTINAIVSQHTPHEVEFKRVEFQLARPGITGLQTVLPDVLKAGLDLSLLVEKLALEPRKLLRVDLPALEIGLDANLVLVDPELEWTLDESSNYSKSRNSPYFGEKLKGGVAFAINKQHVFIPGHTQK